MLQLYNCENKLHFDERTMIMSGLY